MNNLPPEVAALLMHGAALTSSIKATVGSAELDRLLTTGTLRAQPGVDGVLVHPPGDGRWTAVTARQLRCPRGASACRLACWVFQASPFDTRHPEHFDFVSPARSRITDVRTTSSLPEIDICYVAGLRVTSPARTLADLGVVCDDHIVERVGERLLFKGMTTEDELWRVAARLKQRGRQGIASLTRFLRQRGAGTPPTESDLETRFLQATRALGFPQPTHRQYLVERPGREPLRIDFAWRTHDGLVLVEVDGAGTHANPDALIADLRRQNQLQVGLQGLRPVLLRFTAADVDHQPHFIGDALKPWLPHRQAHGVALHLGQPAA